MVASIITVLCPISWSSLRSASDSEHCSSSSALLSIRRRNFSDLTKSTRPHSFSHHSFSFGETVSFISCLNLSENVVLLFAFLGFFKVHLSNFRFMKEIKTERTTIEYEISRNSPALESTPIPLNMNQGFIVAQRREFMTMMHEFWSSTSSASLERWNAADLDFFDLAYDEKTTTEPMQHAGKDTFFRDIHLFIDRVKDFAMIKSYDAVRNNLHTCLRGVVMTWYTTKLFEETKELVKAGNNLDFWERYLIKRFREITIIKERYIFEDANKNNSYDIYFKSYEMNWSYYQSNQSIIDQFSYQHEADSGFIMNQIIVDSSKTWIYQLSIFIMNQVIILDSNQRYSERNSSDDQSRIYYE